jgi:hypothetical protein
VETEAGDDGDGRRVRLRAGAYRRSWRQAFGVLSGDPHATSCLVTSMTDPGNSHFLVCWPMYRDGENVYVQKPHHPPR